MSPIDEGRPGARRDAEDVRPAALARSTAAASRAPAPRQEPALPGRGRGPRPPRPPDVRRAPALPRARREAAEDADVPRSRFTDGGELVLTEAGKKKRAGVWLVTPRAARRGARAPRPGRARARRGRARRDPAPRAAPAPSRCSATSARSRASAARMRTRSSARRASRRSRRSTRALDGGDRRGCRAAIARRPRARASSCARQGKGDAVVYRVHNRLGEPCPQCGTPIARVDFEEHTIYYCPSCQTGGRHAQGSPALTPAALALATRATRARRRSEARGRPAGLAARDRARALAGRCLGRPEGGAHPPRRRGDGDGGRDRLHRRPRRRPEGRPHVALPRALRGGDRASSSTARRSSSRR